MIYTEYSNDLFCQLDEKYCDSFNKSLVLNRQKIHTIDEIIHGKPRNSVKLIFCYCRNSIDV